MLVIGAWAGLVADRSDKRRLLMIVQTFAMVQSFVLAALAFMDHPPLLAIYAVAFAGGVATAFDNPARRSFVVEMVPVDDVQNAVSLNSRADDRRPHRRARRSPACSSRPSATGGASRSTASPTSPSSSPST